MRVVLYNKYARSIILIILVVSCGFIANAALAPLSLEDLVSRVHIPLYSLSPDGKRVAYLTLKPLPRENLHEVVLNLIPTSGSGAAVVLARYRLTTSEAMHPNSGGVNPSTGQFAWSPDSTELIYTMHVGSFMEMRKRVIRTEAEQKVLSGMRRIELGKSAAKTMEFTTWVGETERNTTSPPDDALLIKDSYSFFGPFGNPKANGKFVAGHWSYSWGASKAEQRSQDPPDYLGMPVERPSASPVTPGAEDTFTNRGAEVASPDGTAAVMVERGQEIVPKAGPRPTLQILLRSTGAAGNTVQTLVPRDVQPWAMNHTILSWSLDSKLVYYLSLGSQASYLNVVDREGRIRNVLTDNAGLSALSGTRAVNLQVTTGVFVRSTNVMPDELVAVDLKSGKMTTLARPNAGFETKEAPIVRFISLDEQYEHSYGRLYLPDKHQPGQKYPLVITNYDSYPGFQTSVGEEVPVHLLVANGIAVLAMYSREFNAISTNGNSQIMVQRLARPLTVMESAIKKLSDEGIIDRDRVGLTGLSYGAEIAMWAYWKSHAFRAFSVAGPGFDTMSHLTAGVVYSNYLERYAGVPVPGDPAWKELSLGLNARPDLPPLLMQSAEREAFYNVEDWSRLRKAEVSVEWFTYPDEGHVKTGPAHKWWVYQRNLDWFRFWLKDEEDPDRSKAEQYVRWRAMRDKLAWQKTKTR